MEEIIINTQVCIRCNLTKSLNDYHNDSDYISGHKSSCKLCIKNKIPKYNIMNDILLSATIKRVCTTCKVEKSLADFGNRNGKVKYKYNKDSVCKICKADYENKRIMSDPIKKAKLYANNKIWREKNPGRYRGVIFPSKWKGIGVNFDNDGYQTLLKKQNGLCAICQLPETNVDKNGRVISLSVDHCHVTNRVRGLLCGNCNRAIGLLKDNPEIIFNAALYLKNIES